MKIVPVKDLGNTPAKVSRRTGTIYLNCEIWDKLPKQERKAIYYHEKGHYELNTSNEFEADNYAFEQYAGTEKYSLKGLLHALGDNLDLENNTEHKKRYISIVEKLLKFDYEHNNNLKALQKLIEMKAYDINKIFPSTYKALLFQMLVDFLKGKDISSIESVPEDERLTLLTEFFQLPAVVHLLYRTAEINTADSLFGKTKADREAARQARIDARQQRKDNRLQHKKDKQASDTGFGKQVTGTLTQALAPVLGGAISKIGQALGVPVPPETTAKLFDKLGNKISKRGDTIATSKQNEPPMPGGVPPQNWNAVTNVNTQTQTAGLKVGTSQNGDNNNPDGKAKTDKKIKPWQIASGISAVIVISLIIYYITK